VAGGVHAAVDRPGGRTGRGLHGAGGRLPPRQQTLGTDVSTILYVFSGYI